MKRNSKEAVKTIDRELYLELQRQVYKRSYYEFFKRAYKELLPGEIYSDNWHIKLICDVLQNEAVRIAKKQPKTKDLNINLPFRSTKSLITSICFAPWVWANVSMSIKFIFTSYLQDLAYEQATDSRDLVRSEWYKELFPNVKLKQDQDNKGLYKLAYGGGYRKSVGVGGQITGSGADIICLPAGELILTENGYMDIAEIVENKLSVKVASYNHDLEKVEYKPILDWEKNEGRPLVRVSTVMGNSFRCTEDHPVWTIKEKGVCDESQYISAKDVWGHRLLLILDSKTVFEDRHSERSFIKDVPDYVYNVKVESNSNYFVNKVLVHNCGDDIQDPRRAASEVERAKSRKFWMETLASRLNQPDTGLKIHIQQRLHEEDVTGVLMAEQQELYNFISIPAKLERYKDKVIEPIPKSLVKFYKNGLFWESRFSDPVLEKFKVSLGTQGYIGQLQQAPAPLEGGLIKRDWFDILEPDSISRDYSMEPMLFYLDTAETEKTQNDYTAILSCFKKDNYIYITNVVQVKKEFFQLCKYIPVFCHQNLYMNGSKIKVEPKSSGKSVVSQLRATSNLNVVELKPPKDDKVTRGAACSPTLEARKVKLVRGSYIPQFLDQICTFPNAANDDMYDVLIHCVEDLLEPDSFDFAFI